MTMRATTLTGPLLLLEVLEVLLLLLQLLVLMLLLLGEVLQVLGDVLRVLEEGGEGEVLQFLGEGGIGQAHNPMVGPAAVVGSARRRAVDCLH